MSSDTPFFSIVLPTYNRAHTLERAIGSVLVQTESDWELIVVDDASTDETRSVIANFEDNRLKYVCHKKNRHVAAARNTGIRLAKGKYICFIDSDDEYLPRHLETLREVIKGLKYPKAYFYTLSYRVADSLKTKQDPPVCTKKTPVLLGDNPDTPTICIHSTILEKYQFNEAIVMHEDAELWSRIASKFPIYPIHDYTVFVHKDGEDRLSNRSLSDFRELEKTYRFIWKDRKNRVHIPKIVWRKKMHNIYIGWSYHHSINGNPMKAIYRLLFAVKIHPSFISKLDFWRSIYKIFARFVRKRKYS